MGGIVMNAKISLKLHTVLIASVLILLSSCTSVAQSGGKPGWDVLGVNIGQPLNEAKATLKQNIINCEFLDRTVAYSNYEFKTPDSYIEVRGENELITIYYDASPEKRILGIERFFNLTKPTSLEIILNALVVKYGAPINSSDKRNYYFLMNNPSSKQHKAEAVVPILYDVIEKYWFVVNVFYLRDEDVPDIALLEPIAALKELQFDGVVLKARIDESNGIAEHMKLTLIDVTAFKAHIKYLAETLDRGEAAIQKKEKEKADQAEPPKL